MQDSGRNSVRREKSAERKRVPSMQNLPVKGDQYVTIQIQVPKAVSREAASKLKEYGMAMDRSCKVQETGKRSIKRFLFGFLDKDKTYFQTLAVIL